MNSIHPFDRHLATVMSRAAALRDWSPADGPMPALYLGHGAPPLMEDGHWMDQLFGWTQKMPKPKAILIVSAHWEEAPTTLSAPEGHSDLVYDFGGFDRKGQSTSPRRGIAARIIGTRPRPRGVGAAQSHVPVGRCPCPPDEHADP